MGENTKIEWTYQPIDDSDGEVIPGYTFNPWVGCAKVSPGCANCYAEALMDRRYGRVRWGIGEARSRTSVENWVKPLRWNTKALLLDARPRVFCASLADWLDDEAPIEWLAELLDLVALTPNLDWLLLTKRIHNWRDRLILVVSHGLDSTGWVADWIDGKAPDNVWLGTTTEDQQRANERVPALVQIPAKVRFLSAEPLLKCIDFTDLPLEQIDWVILGGESGTGARVCDAAWMRRIIRQCGDRAVPVFVKQLGSNFQDGDFPERDYRYSGKGGDMAQFPFDLQRRDQPRIAVEVAT